MKKKYEKPVIEISLYLVNEAFAGCDKIVNMGPSTAMAETTCSDYLDYEDQGSRPTTIDDGVSTAAIFYIDQEDASCGCYLTSGTNTILSS